jgi:hypothetical protein
LERAGTISGSRIGQTGNGSPSFCEQVGLRYSFDQENYSDVKWAAGWEMDRKLTTVDARQLD